MKTRSGKIISILWIAIAATCAASCDGPTSTTKPSDSPTSIRKPSGPYLRVTRTALSQGRTDVVRPVSEANPMGLKAWAGFGVPAEGVPGLLTTIAAQPNPLMISIDTDRDGGVDGPANPIVAAAAPLRTCFSLVVAEGFPVEGVRWENIGTRDSSGSLYATVDIPSANIFAGMELITEDELNAYTANSIIYEAPDWGVSPADVDNPKGGRINVRAAPRPQPSGLRREDLIEAPEMNWAIDVRVEIEVVSTCTDCGGGIQLTLRANLFGFDPVGESWFRWAYHSNNITIVKDVQGDNVVTLTLPGKRSPEGVVEGEEGELANLWVAVSSKEPPTPGVPNPFVQQPPEQYVGNMTFVTVGSAVATMIPNHRVTPTGRCAGGRRCFRLVRTKITRGCFLKTVHCERQPEEIVEGPPGTIKHTVSRQIDNEEYKIEATINLQVPLSVVEDESTPATGTFDVTWDWQNLGENRSLTPARGCVYVQSHGNFSFPTKWLKQGDRTPIATGLYSLKNNIEGQIGIPAAYGRLENWLYLRIFSGCGVYDDVQVTLVYEPEEGP